MAVRTVAVRLQADVAGYVAGMRRAAESTKSFSQRLNESAATGKLDAVADRAGLMGAALAGAAGYAVKSFIDFDKQMSAVQAATKASAGEMDKLRAAAVKAGADTKYSATEAAKGIEELAKAGVSTQDILSGGLNGALALAAAGEIDVGEAAETAASAMTQFKLKGQDLPHVADLLAAGAGKAQGSVQDMGQALNQAGLVASQTGLSIEETTGTLAAFASAGLLGSDAGTSFKTMLLMLQAPSGKTKELMDDLGISAYDAQGQFVGITNLAQQLRDKLGKLTPELRANAMAQIFGSDATRAASILYEQGAQGIQGWIDKTNDAGFAAETARIKTDNLAGDLERLKGSLDTLAIQAGSGSNGGLRVLLKVLDELVDGFGSMPPVMSQTVAALGLVGGGALLAGAGWVKMRRSTAEALDELRSTGPVGERAAKGLERTRSAAGKAAGAFLALQVAGAAVDAAMGGLNPQVDALGAGLEKFAGCSAASGEAARLLGGDMGKLDTALKDVADTGRWSSFARGFAGTLESLIPGIDQIDDSLTNSRTRLSAVDEALQQMVQSGHGQQAASVFQMIADRAAKQGVSVNELKQALPGYAAAVETAGSSAEGAAGQTAGLTGQLQDSKKAAEEAKEAFDALFEQYMSSDQAALKYASTLASTNKELSHGTRTLSLNSEEGVRNRQSMLDLVDAINGQRTANINNGMSLDAADAKYKQQIGSLIKTSTRMGYTKTDVEKLLGKYREIPPKVDTKLSVSNAGPVTTTLTRLSAYQQALKEGRILPGFQGPVRGSDGKYYAGGGWTGPGAEFDEAGVVHADEFVIRKSSRRQIESAHPGLLDAMNDTGAVPAGYARGGRVVWPYPVTVRDAWRPSKAQAAAAVIPAVPAGGRTGPWIELAARAIDPDARVISGYRPGARTLSGNLSLHALDRARDFAPSRKLAAGWDRLFGSRTTEAITPYQQFNRLHGKRHTYTGAVWAQHNFAGGNAHDHIAMAGGGVIREPIWGVGASGKTYSFGEGWRPETVTPGVWQRDASGGGSGSAPVYNVNVSVPASANQAEVGRQVVVALQAYERGSGASWRK